VHDEIVVFFAADFLLRSLLNCAEINRDLVILTYLTGVGIGVRRPWLAAVVVLYYQRLFDRLPRIGHGESRESGRVEIQKTWLQTALAWCLPTMSAAG